MASNRQHLHLQTSEGTIRVRLFPDAAPETVTHICQLVDSGLFNGTSFYRSDFVIQCGLHGSGKQNPFPDLKVNETKLYKKLSNVRGTCAVAHFDVPDNGNSEFFINLGANTHLDDVYGGYCVFAAVDNDDTESLAVVDRIADVIAKNPEQASATRWS